MALLKLVGWQIFKRITGGSATIRYHGLRLRCYPDSRSASAAIYFNGCPDHREMVFMRDYLKKGDGFIDIGANIGLYTLLAASIVGKTGRIDAFEPAPRTADRLQEQITRNRLSNVTVHRIAVTDTDGTVEFHVSEEDSTNHVRGINETAVLKHEVKAARLDNCLSDADYAMGKMDIEGAEPLALRGAEKMLARCNPPVWQLELSELSARYGSDRSQVVEQLANAGYDCAVYEPRTRTLMFTDRPWEAGSDNALAIARKWRINVLERLKPDRAASKDG